MQYKNILFVILFIMLLIPTVHAQTVAGWSISTDRPFYFVGDSMNITVRGTAGLNYSLDLVNVSNFNNTIHLKTRTMPENNTDRVEILLDEDYVKGGVFYLNVSVGGHHMAHCQVKIDYSKEYLHQKEHEWIRNTFAMFERIINNIARDMHGLADDVARLYRANFVVFLTSSICLELVIYHVVIPRFYAWSQIKAQKSKYKRQRMGMTANQIQWHDMNLNTIPDNNRPNLNTLAENLETAGFTPDQAGSLVMDATGEAGMGDIIKEMVTTRKWNKMKDKARADLRLNQKVEYQAFLDEADDYLKEFENRLKRIHNKYLKESKGKIKSEAEK